MAKRYVTMKEYMPYWFVSPCCWCSLGQTSKCKSGTLTDTRSSEGSNSRFLSYTTSKHWPCLCSDGDLWPLGIEGFYLTQLWPYTCCLHPQMRCDLWAFCTLETSIFDEVLFIAVQQWTQKYLALKMIKWLIIMRNPTDSCSVNHLKWISWIGKCETELELY